MNPGQRLFAENDHIEARRLQETGAILPLEKIISRVQPLYPGRIIEVELEKNDGRIVYEIEIINNEGIVVEVTVDAVTGEVLSVENDN